MNKFRFTTVREVKRPTRSNKGDAGLDFYMPTNLTMSDIITANAKAIDVKLNSLAGPGSYSITLDKELVNQVHVGPGCRILIPSGIKALLEPVNSMMMAANKSGLASTKGLIFTAEICDSPYTGEYHIGIYNASSITQTLKAGDKLMQFIHVPVYLSEPEYIDEKAYEKLSKDWGTRGDKGFGSTDNK